MANYKFLDFEGLKHLIEQIKANYVQKETGKSLTTNDFTNELLSKLEGVAVGADVSEVKDVNGQIGNVVLSAKDIKFTSSKPGAIEKTIAAALNELREKDESQDSKISEKANAVDVYTKQEIDDSLNAIDSGVISVNGQKGIVTLHTDDLSDQGKVNKFVTVEEKQAWNAKSDLIYVNEQLATKVDKVAGKGLSTNDFTDQAKGKLDNIAQAAQVNTIELIKRNGTNVEIASDKSVNILVPTSLGDLVNNVDFVNRTEIEEMISKQGKMKKVVVDVLPAIADADENTMYLVANESVTNPGFIEYMVIQGKWEILGDTASVDFTGYIKETDIISITYEEINQAFSLA